ALEPVVPSAGVFIGRQLHIGAVAGAAIVHLRAGHGPDRARLADGISITLVAEPNRSAERVAHLLQQVGAASVVEADQNLVVGRALDRIRIAVTVHICQLNLRRGDGVVEVHARVDDEIAGGDAKRSYADREVKACAHTTAPPEGDLLT